MESMQVNFFTDRVHKGVSKIYQAQLNIAKYRVYNTPKKDKRESMNPLKGQSGDLMRALEHPQYRITPSGDGVEMVSTIPLYMRFLDMRKYGNFAIYNRQVWGILYRDTLGSIKYEYSEYVATQIKNQLSDALK